MSLWARIVMALALLTAALGLAWRFHVKAEAAGRNEVLLEQMREARRIESGRNLNILEATNASILRERAARADAAAARNELDGLRNEIAVLSAVRDDAPAACAARTAAVANLLGQCAGRYSDLAERADRHVEDVRTLIDAWPKE